MNSRNTMLAALGIGALATTAGVLAGGRPVSRLHRKSPWLSMTASSQSPKILSSPRGIQERRAVQDSYAKLPITFVENRGQTNRQVRYFVEGSGYAFFLTPDEIDLVFLNAPRTAGPNRQALLVPAKATAASAKATAGTAELRPPGGVALGLRFIGSNPRVMVDGAERAPGNVNYFRGSDPAAWKTDVPGYRQVVYRELWSGVDLAVREKDGTLKYEFRVHPGANVEDIRLAYRGAESLELDGGGGLVIQTALGALHDSAPVSFQEIDGVPVPVESRYVLQAGSDAGKGYAEKAYGFHVGPGYRADHELIIDPGVAYSTFLGGTDHEIANGIAVDAAGNAYVVGWTQSADFPTTVGAFARTGAVGTISDVFVAKINPAGTALVYSTFIGGSDFDFGRAIAIDGAGNAYISGQTKSANFPVTRNAFDRTLNILACPRCAVDNYDAFVAKLNPTGSALVYSTYLGGATDIDDALGIAVDAAGNAYVTGETGSTDFPTTPGAFRTTRNGAYDAYVTKLNPTGSALVYSTFIGGINVDFGVAIAVDALNNAYVVGNTSSPDFPTTPGAFNTISNGGFDLFVLKLNAAGSNLVYSTFLGGLGMDLAGGLAIDSAGNAYVSGASGSANFPTTPGAFQTTSSTGFGGAVVTKLNPTGSALIYSTFLGDAGATGIALTPAGNVWVTGSTTSPTFPTTPDAFQSFYHAGPTAGTADAFLTELNGTGSAILYSTYLGGFNTDYGTGLALDAAGNVYVAGETVSADFPVTANVLDPVFKGSDAFITKFALNGTAPPPPPLPTVAAVTPAGDIVGGNTVGVTVTLTGGAQGSGAVVSLTSSNPAALSLPAIMTIPAGVLSGAVTAATSVVSVNTPVTISASYNNSSNIGTMTVLPPPPPAALNSLGFLQNVVAGGDTAVAILSVTNPAPAGGFTATISTNNPVATVPASVTVPQGLTNVSFPVPTAAVTTTTGLTISANAGGLTRLAPLTVNPKAPPVTTSALTVSATGRSGNSVTSSPAGINVAVGKSQSASFTTGTAITLTVSNGRSAIWTGACSSGGTRTKTCTFTLTANAAVTANVQ